MTVYAAPLADMRFVLRYLAGLDDVRALPGLEDATPDLVDAVIEEAGKFGADVLAPLNHVGDRAGCVLENGMVRTPPGFKEAYRRFCEGGWNGVPFDPEIGGQGLPWLVATAVSEIWDSANMAFGLCPLLTQGAVELLSAHGSPEQKATYLPHLVSGAWNGTMNLTEPQAGSDLGRVRARAVRDGDRWRIIGQKIFITYGEHDFTDNIVHMVLARAADAPEGVRGISLFVVPKFLVNADGSLGKRNDLRCVSIEHKLGIHASPTAVMSYGDDGGAIGELVGEENRGLEYMFTMMNNARLSVGLQGIGVAERAYQQALVFARERIQSRALDSTDPAPVPIARHPDVRRMLLSMRARTEAARALAYYVAGQLDIAKRHPDPKARAERQARVDLLIPVVKAWGSEAGSEVADLGIQVHGGMGYIEETGAAQYLRDARIASIYEGTNGIQALDLVGRKVGRDEGRAVLALAAEISDTARALAGKDIHLSRIGKQLDDGARALEEASRAIVKAWKDAPTHAAAGAIPYLRLVGTVVGGWLMARAAMEAERLRHSSSEDATFLNTKIVCARFYGDQYLVPAAALAEVVCEGANSVLALSEEQI